MAYEKLNWQDGKAPAVSAENLNHMDEGIAEAQNPYTAAQLLSDTTRGVLGLGSDTTPDDAFKILGGALKEKLLLDYTTEEEAQIVQVPLTDVDWESCAVAVIKIIPSAAQEIPDGLWVDFDSLSGHCRSLYSNTQYNYFAPASLSGESMIFLFVGHNSKRDIAGITAVGYEVYACSHGRNFANKTTLKLSNPGSGKTAAGTKIQIWGIYK